MPPTPDAQLPRIRSGEPFVWATAMGLTVGLVMILYLLGLIVLNGYSAFWPKRVAWVELKSDSSARLQGSNVLAGEIVKQQQKTSRTLSAPQAAQEGGQTEMQFFIGNKDVYGIAFRYVDGDDIARIRYPLELMLIERLEYGDAIGVPVALDVQSEGTIAAHHDRFYERLRTLVKETNRRWQKIRRIERHGIGTISARMEKLRIQQRTLLRDKTLQASSRESQLAAIQETLTTLQSEYEVLAQQTRHLRAQQATNTLTYRLSTGQEQQLALGQVVHFIFPNQLNIAQRLVVFMRNIWMFLSQEPREANTEGGVFPAIFGTFVMTVMMSVVVMPFGVIAAVYLREYAKQGLVVRAVRIAVNNLAGVPSIVFGVFGLGFFVYLVGGTLDDVFFADALPTPTFGTGGIFWASLTLALMTVPVVIVATEEALATVPRGMREGSLACGASKWQTILRIVLPAASPGILTGLILAMARGAGEVAPLMLVGVVKLAPSLPIDYVLPFIHLERKFMHLGFHIYDLGFQSPDAEAAKPMVYATTLLLITLVVVLNIGAIFIRDRLRRKYATGAF